MNGVHDMGGMQDFGRVAPEPGEPVFHHDWERRVMAMTLAMGATGVWSIDQSRSARESLPPVQYLSSSYYELWLHGLISLMLEHHLITPAEIADGRLHEAAPTTVNVLKAVQAAPMLARGKSTQRPPLAPARHGVGDAVRTRNLNPATHTRLPRYCRGKPGTIVAVHGAHVFPDAIMRGDGEDQQWLYTVRFTARDLWGPDTTASSVCVDCWEPYLDAG